MSLPSITLPQNLSRNVPRLLAVLTLLAACLVSTVVNPPKAHADACFTWGRTLSQGMSGADVRQLQIRIARLPRLRRPPGARR